MSTAEDLIKCEEVEELLEERVFVYNVLKQTFIEEPSKHFLKILLENEVLQSFPLIDESSTLLEGVTEATRQLKKIDILDTREFDKLHWDYTKMFIGPYKIPAPPWESAYLTEERLLFQDRTLEVRRIYLRYNFIPKYYLHEADDHIGLELDFMYQLSKMVADKFKTREIPKIITLLNDQKYFLEEHLLKWVPMLTADIIKNADTEFYSGMAKILNSYLKLDHQVVVELLDKVNN
ncbi:TorA maturation chaperone TorD [Desulfohalotomaculum tongense]|uniref:TorD/DmsD family molecular chaperone n=1 Tax=Desulforadius tongensis TaxID=1216062 RepID=UPI00195ACF09|nr:molecular chaperone TorD family protein [Desulforadius tongensis]MBM7854112.1 TorA maturation chaperone TorD [Desulforadius tongensis]